MLTVQDTLAGYHSVGCAIAQAVVIGTLLFEDQDVSESKLPLTR